MRLPRVTRRGLQVSLGLLWLLDTALQAQPFMWGRGFAEQIIRPAGDGTPLAVQAPVHWAASLVAAHPVLTNAGFVVVQGLLAVGLLWRRSARLACAGTVAWGLAVWWLGEGIGGLASGVSLLDGAPGAALLYAVVAIAAWPGRDPAAEPGAPPRLAVALPAWLAVWLSGAELGGQPAWVAGLEAAIGVVVIAPGVTRYLAAAAGAGIGIGIWVTVQQFGEIATGTATDPNTGPLLVLLALAVGFGRSAALDRLWAATPAPPYPGGRAPSGADRNFAAVGEPHRV